jgi:hypothetical protein
MGYCRHRSAAIFYMPFFTSITYLATLDVINFVLGLQSNNSRPALQSSAARLLGAAKCIAPHS